MPCSWLGIQTTNGSSETDVCTLLYVCPPPPLTTPALLVPVFSTKLAGCSEKEERGNECKIFLHNGPS